MPPVSQQLHFRIVQSRQNSRVKELRACLSSGAVSEHGRIGIEGEHLLIEAARSGTGIATVFLRSDARALLARIELEPRTELIELPPEIFASAVTTESPQGIAALVTPKSFSIEEALRGKAPFVVIADGLQDPGNLGTLIRSAEAFGAGGMITLPGTVSPWNSKAMRASSGSVFRLPVVSASAEEVFSRMKALGIEVVAAVAERGLPLTESEMTGPLALLIGNEGRGLSPELLRRADRRVTIPCPGPVESLNAAVAGSILLYEVSRQRETRGAEHSAPTFGHRNTEGRIP